MGEFTKVRRRSSRQEARHFYIRPLLTALPQRKGRLPERGRPSSLSLFLVIVIIALTTSDQLDSSTRNGDVMRFFFTLLLTEAVGIGLWALVCFFLRNWFPVLAVWVFVLGSVYWLYLGWKYCELRDHRTL
jgi:hypothetical protein